MSNNKSRFKALGPISPVLLNVNENTKEGKCQMRMRTLMNIVDTLNERLKIMEKVLTQLVDESEKKEKDENLP